MINGSFNRFLVRFSVFGTSVARSQSIVVPDPYPGARFQRRESKWGNQRHSKKNGEQTGPERDRSGGTRLPPRRHSFVSAKLNTIEDDEEFLNGRRGSAHWCLWSERNFEVGTPSQSKWQHAVRLRSILLFCSSNWNQHLARSFSQLDKCRMPWRISPCHSCLLTQEGDRMLPFPPPGTSTQCEASPPLLLAVRPLISFWPHRAENHPTADSFAIRR